MRRRVRLAHIFSSDLAIPGALPYMRPLLDRGWEVTFLTPPGPLVSKASAQGIRWEPIEFTRTIDPVGDAKASARLVKLLGRERFDIFHTHNFKVSLVGRVLAGLVRTRIVLHTIHGITWALDSPEPKRTANAVLERIASVPADLILSQSRADRDAFLGMKVVPPEKIRLIGNGVDLSRFDPARVPTGTRERERAAWGIRDDEVAVLFAGRIVREKGLEEVFEASGELAKEGVRIVIAGRDDLDRGDAPSAESIEKAKRANVVFAGERSDMPALYAACDIVGLASWREGMPRVLIEGAAMQKPLFATDIRGCREVVQQGETGILVEAKNPIAIRDGLRELAKDRPRREAFAKNARKDALSRFDLGATVGRVVDAYDELIQKKGLR